MIYGNVEFHNAAEAHQLPEGVAMQRVPETVRQALNPNAADKMLRPASGEIRFYAEPGTPIRVTLSAAGPLGIVPFFGDHRQGGVLHVGQQPTTITLSWNERFVRCLGALRERPHAFDPCVVRLRMWGEPVRFHGVEGAGIRPPAAGEVPALRYLAYGTSITHGSAALAAHLSYAAQTATRLGADLLNFGVGGACQCEPELADYLAERDDWHVASLALSVNMMGFSEDEFERRVRYMVHRVSGSNASRPVACITLFSYFGDLALDEEPHTTAKVSRFREILRQAVHDCPTANAHLVEGPDVLPAFGGLTTDLIHPADDGMIRMGEVLARRLQELLNTATNS